MEQFIVAAAHGRPAEYLVDECLAQLGCLPAEANLGFVYATDELVESFAGILARLRESCPGIAWVGTIGMGLCTRDLELYDEAALVLMVGAFPPGSFHLLPTLKGDQLAIDPGLASWWRAQDFCFAVLHGDPTNPMTPAFLEQLAAMTPDIFINGGITSSKGQHYQVAGTLDEGGLSGVLFNSRVAVATDHTQGCSPIGPVHRLNQARQNVAISLDGRPALEVMKEEIGEVLARDLTKIGGYIFVALPIPGSDTGDYLVRNLIGIDEKRGLVAIGDYLDGQSQLMFCRRDGNTAQEDMKRMLERLRKRLGGQRPKGGLYISCLGRGRYQFGEDSEELKLISEGLGSFPLVGFFANGEIYNGRLYGYTGVLTLFL